MATTPRPPVAPRRRRTIAAPRWTGRTTIVGIGVLLVAAPLAVLAWSQPADGVQLDHDGRLVQQATFSYTASAQPSLVYPDGVVGPVTVDTAHVTEPTDSLFDAIGPDAEITEVAAPPVPLYRELIDGLTVELDYTAVPDGIAADVAGTIGVEAVATNRDGWTHTTVLVEEERFDGSWDGEVEVPLATIDATMLRQAELTGQPVATYELVIRATVDVEASTSDRTVEAGLLPELAFGVGGPTLVPASGLVSSDTVHLGRQVAGPTTVTIGPLELTTGPARGASALAIILALVALGFAAAARTGLLSGDPSVRVRIRYSSLLVTIPPGSRVPGRAVPIGTIRELAKLARAENGVMLHEPFGPRLHRYLVPAGDVVYVHVMAPDEPGEGIAGVAHHLDPGDSGSSDEVLAPPRWVGGS